MIIIWRGLGFLVPLIGIAGLLATQSVVGNGYYQAHGWPKFAAGLVAGLLVLLAGCGLNKNRQSPHVLFHSRRDLGSADLRLWYRGVLVEIGEGAEPAKRRREARP